MQGGGVCAGRDTGASGLGAGKGSIFHQDDNYTDVRLILLLGSYTYS